MARKHHTKRLVSSRRKLIDKWTAGFIGVNHRPPHDSEIKAFVIGVNMGYKEGRKHALNPVKQESPRKSIMDSLFQGKITFDEAKQQLGVSSKKLYKLMDNYTYIPTNEEMHECHEYMMQTLKDMHPTFHIEDIEISLLREIPRWQAKNEISNYIKANKLVYLSDIVEYLRLDIEIVMDVLRTLQEEGNIRESMYDS